MVIDHLNSGGAQVLLADLVAGLDRRRFEVIVCSLRPSQRYSEKLEEEGVEVIQCPGGPCSPLTLWQVLRLVRKRRIDVVHTHLSAARILGGVAGWLGGAKKIFAHDHSGDEYLQKNPLLAWAVLYPLDRLLATTTTRVFAVSAEIFRFNTEVKNIPGEKVEVIHNWIDTRRFAGCSADPTALRVRWKVPPEARVVGAVGRLNRQKGFRHLIKAAPEILKNQPQTVFVVIGEGAERPALQALAEELGVERAFRFLGFMPEVELAYPFFDLFVLPSDMETFGLALLEAMAAGCPVVASRVGGVPEIVRDEVDGLLVCAQAPQELAAAICRLLGDADLRQRLCAAARHKVAECFDRERAIGRLEQWYEDGEH